MRILVVEDDTRLADVLLRALTEEGYAVDTANDGETASWMARATDYDALILDVMLPGQSGLQLCASLRADDVQTPVLMLTAQAGIAQRVAGLDAGADDYLPKPFDIDELFARVRALVRRGPAPLAPTLHVGELNLDPATRTVTRSGQQLELSTKEFAVLETLMRRAGKVVTRFDILEHVWDGDSENNSNVINVYIKNIRNQLDRPFGTTTIETIRGVGYRLATSEDAWRAQPSPEG